MDGGTMKDDSDDFKLRGSYQDDLDTGADDYDPLMQEENDDPSELLGVPPEELGDELDKYAPGDDDAREFMEEQDE